MDQNDTLQKALVDISLIKQTMQKSRVQMKRLSMLFFLYGGIHLVLMIGWLILWLFFRDTPFFIPLLPFFGITHAFDVIILIFYLVWRRELKKTENNYTIYLYDIWGYVLFTIPLLVVLCFGFGLLFSAWISRSIIGAMAVIFWLGEQLIFFLGIAVMGFLLNARGWKIFSALITAVYFLSFLFMGSSIGSLQEISASTLIGNYWGSVQVIWMAICPAIALVIGFYFLPDQDRFL